MSAFKGFQSVKRNPLFSKFPNIITVPENYLFGFPSASVNFDAQLGLDTDTDGAQVNRWEDLLSRNIGLAPLAGSACILTKSDVNFNNLPSIGFTNNNNNRFTFTPSIGLNNNFTLVVVSKLNIINANFNLLAIGGGSTTSGPLYMNQFAATKGIGLRNVGGTFIEDPTVNDTLPHIHILTRNEIVTDGVSIVSLGGTPSYNSIEGLGSTGAGTRSNLSLAQFIIFNRAFNSADMIRLCDNVNLKFAIY